MYTMTIKHVYLGRFAPFHNGHKLLLSELILQYGQQNVLVLIGSTNTINERTPYTFEDRRDIIRFSFPDIEVLPLPDGKPNLVYFDGTTNEKWLSNIEDIANARDEKFIFYGGSPADLEILARRFETKIIVSREILKVSATEVRELIKNGELEKLASMVDPNALSHIISTHKKFL